MRFFKIFLFIYISILYCQNCDGCTGIYAKEDSIILFGNNEDHGDPNSYIWFQQPRPGKYGGVYYGFQDHYPQGGMNEKGLSFDHFAQPYLSVTGSSHLPSAPSSPRNGEWVYQMLETCETVNEAISYLRQFNLWFFYNFQLFLADRFGNSAIVEGDSILYKNGDFQVVTNFLQSNPELGNYPCWRYNEATQMLESCDSISIDYFRSILNAVHTNNTCYSNIHDPVSNIIYLYYMYKFENVVIINLKQEFQKGDRTFKISSLFETTNVGYPQNDSNLTFMILHQSYPNPFNKETVVRFQLFKSMQLNINIYDQLGRKVRSLNDTQIWPKGNHMIHWNGQDDFGNQVSTGIYVLQVNGAEFNKSQKLLLIK